MFVARRLNGVDFTEHNKMRRDLMRLHDAAAENARGPVEHRQTIRIILPSTNTEAVLA